MKLFYYRDPFGNFGDDLNPWLFEKMFGNIFNDDEDILLIGVGTLINYKIPSPPKKIVFGSGCGYGKLPIIDDKWNFRFVRGPRSAELLGLSKNQYITDPAALTSLYFSRKEINKKYKFSFMPHCDSAALADWKDICNRAGLNYIDPRKPFLDVFHEICSTEQLFTEAMHGAILADSFRVPWKPIKVYPHILESKWQDWFDSLEVDAEFHNLSPVYNGSLYSNRLSNLKNSVKRTFLNSGIWNDSWDMPIPKKSSEKEIDFLSNKLNIISNNSQFYLSKSPILNNKIEQLFNQIDILKNDLANAYQL